MIFELPMYKPVSGGIIRTITLAQRMHDKHNISLRFQNKNPELDYSSIDFKVPYSIGLPDHTFPKSDIVITYSDNPFCDMLTKLPQVKKVLIYMLSYGMCLERERRNILNQKVTVLASTTRTQRLIEAEGVKCFNVGFGSITVNDNLQGIERKKYAALLYHPAPDKKYNLGVEVCNELYRRKLIDGVLTFGALKGYENSKKPDCLICHYTNASNIQIEQIFKESSIFIMPSITEGLNMTPVEATLYGCPAIICDGAIGDLFFDKETCLIAEKNSFASLMTKSMDILNNDCSEAFKNNMKIALKNHTWEKTIASIESVINESRN